MTLEEIKKLSDRELDARLAEKVLGCTSWDNNGIVQKHFWYRREDMDAGKDCDFLLQDFTPSQSLDAIAPLEAKTLEKFPGRYATDLSKVIHPETDGYFVSLEEGITASARHRAESVLLCWEAE